MGENMKLVFNPILGSLDYVNDVSDYILLDTRDNIVQTSGTAGKLAYATDVEHFYVHDGTNWMQIVPNGAVADTNIDMGVELDSAPTGYGDTYITDKAINNSTIGGGGVASTGGVRVINGVFQCYLNGAWANVVTNFVLREDSTYGYTFEHAPVGFTQYIEIMTGQSLNYLGLNGLPLTNGYKINMGAYGSETVVGGRQIT